MKDRHAKHAPGHKPAAHEEEKQEPAAEASAAAPAAEGKPSEAEQLKERLLRLQADFDNYRKRVTRERTEFAQRATEDLVIELLPVLDHFELGLNTAREHRADASVREGFQLVYDQLMAALAKAGVTPIDAEGQVFNPHEHEAVTHLPSAEVPADTVMQQTRRGYRMGDRLLRAAQVVVSSGPPDAPPAEEAEWEPESGAVENNPANPEAPF